jgi:uncharacterized protein (TIGR00369 family)
MNTNNKYLQLLLTFLNVPFTSSRSEAGKLLNYKLIAVNEGEIKFEFVVDKKLCNPGMHLHGGIYALAMDEAVGLAFFTICNGEYYTTVNLNVEHLYSAPLGETLIATGKVIRHGKKIAYTEGEIHNSANQLICKATSNLINTGKRIFETDVIQ